MILLTVVLPQPLSPTRPRHSPRLISKLTSSTARTLDSVPLPKKLRETAYAVALEVAAADLDVKEEETRLLEMLRDTLEIDKLTATAIERGIRARNLTI